MRNQQVAIRATLLQALATDLVGPMREDEVIPNPPSRWYLTGFLVPRGAPEEQRFDPTATEDLAPAGDGDADDDRGDSPAQVTKPFLPSSCGLSVLLAPGCDGFEVEARWGEYARLSEDKAQALARERGLEPEEADGDSEGDDDEDGDSKKKRRYRFWRRASPITTVLALPSTSTVKEFPGSQNVKVRTFVRPATAPGLPAGTLAASVFLVNEREDGDRASADERTIFQAELRVRCRSGFQARTHHEGTEHPDDRRNDLQYRHRREFAVGHGTSVVSVEAADGTCHEVRTTWLPQARVYRMASHQVPGVVLSMDTLADLDSAAELTAAMDPMLSAYQDWIAEQREQLDELQATRRQTAEALLADAGLAIDRIRAGMGSLEEDADAFLAFKMANRAMAMAARQARPGAYTEGKGPEWRLFQLAFVLLNLAGVVDPAHADRSTVELLFFPTGGGKTEAYLGVAAFAMILRRLRHRQERHQGAGVSVILRYTLRLLTLDQLGRAATLTCALELMRREKPALLGTMRFQVGLWVGRKATANTLDDAARQVAEYKGPKRAMSGPPVPLVGCPWCGAPFEPDSFEIVKEGRKPIALRVGCTREECAFSFPFSDDLGLPVVVVDEQLYRELPSFLIATVDKFASLPWRGASGMLFGKVQAQDQPGDDSRGHFYGEHEAPPKSAQRLHGLLPPDLILQDELHLITGPLGTMVGLYETAIDRLSRNSQGHGPKIVASTATARRAGEQIRALFGRDRIAIFPPQGLTDEDNFFSKVDRSEDQTRLYLGVAAPGRSPKRTLAHVYSSLLAATYKQWRRLPGGRDNPADTYMTLVAYFNALRELGGAQRLVLEEVGPRVARLERRCPVGLDKSDWYRDRLLGFDLLELTSRQDTARIRKAKGRLEAPYGSNDAGKTDVLLASSMISVGIDIPRLGLMVMNGQPRTVAEYIQATSRVGRSTPGLVVTLLNPFKPRDRSHYERFIAFHDCFYRYVESSSVTPFSARALDRGLAGLTVALARHTKRGMAGPGDVENIGRAPNIDDEISAMLAERVAKHKLGAPQRWIDDVERKTREVIAEWKEIVAFMQEHTAHVRYSPWEKERKGTPLLSTAADQASDKHPGFEHFQAPTSMRDVEPTVHFWVWNPGAKNRTADRQRGEG